MKILLRALAYLPLPLSHALGWLLGWLAYADRKRRRMSLLHIAYAYPEFNEQARRTLARQAMQNLIMAFAESPRLWFGAEKNLRRYLLGVQGESYLQTALAQQKGVILLTPHLGAWEFAGLWCAQQAPLTSLYKEQGGDLDALMVQGRTRTGAKLATSDQSGVKALLKALKNGEMLGILPDQDPPSGSGVFVPFFEQTAHTPTLTSKLAHRNDVPVLMLYAQRVFGRGYVIHIQPPLAAMTGDEMVDCTAVNAAVEQAVRALPQQYYWAYPRYRRQMAGVMSPYKQL